MKVRESGRNRYGRERALFIKKHYYNFCIFYDIDDIGLNCKNLSLKHSFLFDLNRFGSGLERRFTWYIQDRPRFFKIFFFLSGLTEDQVIFFLCKYKSIIYIFKHSSKDHYNLIKFASKDFLLDNLMAMLYFDNIKFESGDEILIDSVIYDVISVIFPRYSLVQKFEQENGSQQYLCGVRKKSFVHNALNNNLVDVLIESDFNLCESADIDEDDDEYEYQTLYAGLGGSFNTNIAKSENLSELQSIISEISQSHLSCDFIEKNLILRSF